MAATCSQSALQSVPVASTLERVPWPGSTARKSPQELQTSTNPRLFTIAADASLLAKAPCLTTWNIDRLMSLGQRIQLHTAWSQRQAAEAPPLSTVEFVLARGREAEFARSSAVAFHDNLTLSTFLQAAVAAENSGVTYYHSGPLSSWGAEGRVLADEAEHLLQALALYDAPSDVDARAWPRPSGPIAWVGSPGVLATPHYDKSLNVVVQIFGVKTWRLWPPSHLDSALKMHPFTHPSRRQVRVPLSSATRHSNASAGSSSGSYPAAYSAEMRPGDILFVPPFWTHAVESTTLALSLSVLSPSWEEATGSRLSWPKLPFEHLQTEGRARCIAAVSAYLAQLLPALGDAVQHDSTAAATRDDHDDDASVDEAASVPSAAVETLRTFAAALYASRHAGDETEAALAAEAQEERGVHPAAAAAAMASSLDADLDVGCTALRAGASDADGGDAMNALLGGGALPTVAELAPTVAAVRRAAEWRDGERMLSRPVVRTLIGDYVEQLAAWALGGEAHVGRLLRVWMHCT